ncbi:MAG: SH3 domain-containing protein [Bacteroidales bacterium]|nr:SH3 domain-containing protein [Bacteroidales bacterium]
MEKKYGFQKMDIQEFKSYISDLDVNRAVFYIQQHHTYSPAYSLFNGNNHFDLQKGMKNHHVINNGWSDIGQHFSIFPDGTILTGRSLERSPAGIKGSNANAICIENLGNFDSGKDTMTSVQRDAIVEATATLCTKFNIAVNSDKILYHHWFNLTTGERNNGTGNNKSCPGTAFFGGNKVSDCENNFLPLIRAANQAGGPVTQQPQVLKYVCVTASRLNIREGAGTNNKKVAGIEPTNLGSVLKVFREQNGWYKISHTKEYWVSGRFTIDVKQGTVTARVLNIRSGPGTGYDIIGKLHSKQEVFIESEKHGWYKLCLQEKWISKDYVSLS